MNWTKYQDIGIEAALKAGRMLRENMSSHREITYKGVVDLVTNFDSRSQDIILNHLSSFFPDHDFLAEEDPSERRRSEFRWIIDPIDGTTNFAHSFPVFCISIALEYQDNIAAGIIYDPMRDEIFSAVEGDGAHLNGSRIMVSRIDDLDKSLLATGFPYDLRKSRMNNIDHFINFIKQAQAVRRCGSAALDICYVACGRFDGFWEIKLKPWDVAAASLILSEAGGRASDFHGNPLNIFGIETLGSNGLIHKQMVEVLQSKKKV